MFFHAESSSLDVLKFSRIVIYKSKFLRVDCNLNWGFMENYVVIQSWLLIKLWFLNTSLFSKCNASLSKCGALKKSSFCRSCSRSAGLQKAPFPLAKFTRQVFCSLLDTPMCGKSHKYNLNIRVIMDSSISHGWTLHAIFLSERIETTPIEKC